MKNPGAAELHAHLAHLRALPFVEAATMGRLEVRAEELRADAMVRLRTPKGKREMLVEIKRTHLTRAVVDAFLAHHPTGERPPWILFAPYVGAGLGEHLRTNGVNYVDAAGNCFLAIGRDYLALIEGRRAERQMPPDREVRAAGHQVLFAILAKPDLINAPVRALAEAAGVGKTAAAEMLTRLDAEGLTGVDRDAHRLLKPRILLDRWLAGYAAQVRPKLLVGRFKTNDPDPATLENRIETELGDTVKWGWGGGAAAMRLTRHYHGPDTVLHLAKPLHNIGRRLKAIPAADGPLIVLGVPGSVAMAGEVPGTVHPLLVYTELLFAGRERDREAAEEVWNRFGTGWRAR